LERVVDLVRVKVKSEVRVIATDFAEVMEIEEAQWSSSEVKIAALEEKLETVRANCLATNTEYCNRCTHAATQATNVARIKTERNQGLTRGTRWLG
jgi:hypothetical protein